MDNSNLDDYENMRRPQNGRMSAASQLHRNPVSRPSTDELAPYSAVNYTNHGTKTKYRHGGRVPIVIAVVAAIVLLLIIPGAALAINGMNAMNDARTLMSQGTALVSQIQSGDVQGARRTASNLNSIAKDLDDNVNSLLWAPLTLVPVYGEDVRQVRALANVVNELSEHVLIPITEGLPTDGNARLFVDGGFNIAVIQAILRPLGAESDVVRACAQQVNETGEPHIAELYDPLQSARSLVNLLAEVSEYAGDLSRVLPGILGADGPRTYLIIACSEAELRSVGGFPGSAGLMTIDNGKMQIGDMDAPVLPYVDPDQDVLKLTDEEKLLFGTRAGEFFYDGGYIPHFPRAAEIMKSIWDANGRTPIDGIISLDPVFLQKVLGLIGAVTTSDGVVVDGANAAEILMNTVYIMYSAESVESEADDGRNATLLADARQNTFFGEVASLALDGFFENISSVNMLEAVQVLGESIADKRIYMWVTNPEEQAMIERLDAACAMSVSETEPELGVYVATTIATKGNWYISTDTAIQETGKNADGSTNYTVTTRISNTLTPEEAETLPSLLTNAGPYARERIRSKGDMILDVYLFAPAGGTISNLQVEGDFAPETLFDDMGAWYTRPGTDPMTKASYNGREVWYGVTTIESSKSTVLTYTVTTSSQAVDFLALDTTPLGQG